MEPFEAEYPGPAGVPVEGLRYGFFEVGTHLRERPLSDAEVGAQGGERLGVFLGDGGYDHHAHTVQGRIEANQPSEGTPVDVRHDEVGHQNVEGGRVKPVEGGKAVLCRLDLVAKRLEEPGGKLEKNEVVVDEQNSHPNPKYETRALGTRSSGDLTSIEITTIVNWPIVDIDTRESIENSLSVHAFPKESRGENIASIIRDGIVKGLWKPGDPISDLELSKQLGVSRTSVREALSRLVENRIVERIHWKGYYVRELSWAEVESLVEVRKALEEIAFSRVMVDLSEKLLDRLEECIEAQQSCVDRNDQDGFSIVDPQFHELVYEASKNHWIPYILNNSLTLLNILRSVDKRNDFAEAAQWSVNQHRGILTAMRSRDTDEVLRLLDDHIDLHKERLRRIILR